MMFSCDTDDSFDTYVSFDAYFSFDTDLHFILFVLSAFCSLRLLSILTIHSVCYLRLCRLQQPSIQAIH
jgi:hypothetical protein